MAKRKIALSEIDNLRVHISINVTEDLGNATDLALRGVDSKFVRQSASSVGSNI